MQPQPKPTGTILGSLARFAPEMLRLKVENPIVTEWARGRPAPSPVQVSSQPYSKSGGRGAAHRPPEPPREDDGGKPPWRGKGGRAEAAAPPAMPPQTSPRASPYSDSKCPPWAASITKIGSMKCDKGRINVRPILCFSRRVVLEFLYIC